MKGMIYMNQRKVELLAPAGDFACFQAAINAGADAVYLGGDKFGARAYAGNFTQEEIIEALRIAHLFQKKIYLTVNTLVKEKEIGELLPYLEPLYEAGLDGVIVQDMGVLIQLRRHFPKLELHASTQMTVTGVYGAEFLKQQGVCRIVPARELALEEIRDIKDKTGLAIETFIHGAMCYAYSGQCLFSSILGGRSGNRGRCAGPCRLPYTDEQGHTVYPLSLKDMYTLPIIPELIEAGIDSFKIEGRMKSPEYVAGVTAMYRKYIDAYLSDRTKPYRVSKEDEALLRGLYIRTDICQGYYEQHNGKNMLTLKEAGYLGSDEQVLNNIREKYINVKKTLSVCGAVSIMAGQPMKLTLSCKAGDTPIEVSVAGEAAGEAQNRPIDAAEIRKRISKLGDTCFSMLELEVYTDNHSFVPVKALNELRREACRELEEAVLKAAKNRIIPAFADNNSMQRSTIAQEHRTGQLYASVNTFEQFKEASGRNEVTGIYINADLLIDETVQNEIRKAMEKAPKKRYFAALPYVFRKRSYETMDKIYRLIESMKFDGILVRNIEELQWLVNNDYKGQLIADYTVYAWNRESLLFYGTYFSRHTVPLELNRKELLQLQKDTGAADLEMCVYGRLPLMFSANCVRKTLESCTHRAAKPYNLTDRYHNHFPVAQNCLHCYNIVYNSVPMSLHNQFDRLYEEQYGVYRLDFSIENGSDTARILDYYCGLTANGKADRDFPYAEYTTGHYRRGVE